MSKKIKRRIKILRYLPLFRYIYIYIYIISHILCYVHIIYIYIYIYILYIYIHAVQSKKRCVLGVGLARMRAHGTAHMNHGWFGERPAKRARLRSVLARWSCNSSWQMMAAMSGERMKAPSGAVKRRFSNALAPALSCFDVITAPAVSGEPVQFYCANMARLLQYMANECPCFHAWLKKLQGRLDVVLSHDETTAGNVLQTDSRQKITIVYCNFCAMESLQESPRSWVPLAAIAHVQVVRVDGGMAKVHALLPEHWANQNLENATEITPTVRLRILIRAFVADMDAHRQVLGAKGSAGLKPCSYCRNCVAKESRAADGRKFFNISEPDFSKFEEHTQQGLQAYLQQAMEKLPRMSKVDADMTERCLGYRVEDKGVWFSAACARLLPLSKYVNDSLHVYFANGVACLELNLLVEAVQRHTSKSIQDLQHAVEAAGWKRNGMAARNGQRQYWIRRLFVPSFFTGSLYKGSAAQAVALVKLFRWLAESVWHKNALLRAEATCFAKLCQVLDAIQVIAKTKRYTELIQLQREHLESFNKAWGTGLTRPKHHHALHLAAQYARTGVTPNCWAVESSHRDYKAVFAKMLQHLIREKDNGLGFCRSLMPRLLMRTTEMLNEHPISCSGFSLKREFTSEEVFRVDACNIAGCLRNVK